MDNRIRWACRRGMLELDLFLLPFFDKVYATLDTKNQSAFEMLLREKDPDLLAYLMGHATIANSECEGIVEKIRSFKRGGTSVT